MIPGTYNFSIYEGATFTETWTRSGVATAVGWTAAIDFRETADEDSTRYLGLTSSPAAGLTLSSDGSVLSIAILITAAQSAALVETLEAAGKRGAFYDLKLTKPDATVEYLLRGKLSVQERVTT